MEDLQKKLTKDCKKLDIPKEGGSQRGHYLR